MRVRMEDRCELALMGKVVPVVSNAEAEEMTKYLLGVIKPSANLTEDFIDNTINRYQKNEVRYIVCNTVMDMPCITYLLANADEREDYSYPAPFEEDYGSGYPSAFCYVFNTDSDWCSEFGDCFFEKREDGFYHRAS